MEPIMECGHAASTTDNDGNPICVICLGITPKAKIVAKEANLEGREAQCPNCSKVVPSDSDLPFFLYRPSFPYDSYYCGCRGWN